MEPQNLSTIDIIFKKPLEMYKARMSRFQKLLLPTTLRTAVSNILEREWLKHIFFCCGWGACQPCEQMIP